MRVGSHPRPGSPLPPGGALAHFGVQSYLETPRLSPVAVPPELCTRVPRTFQLCGNCLERRGGGSQWGTRKRGWGRQGNGDPPDFLPVHGHFVVCTSDGWRLYPGPSPRPREIISRVLFSLAGSNFWLTPFAP